MIGNDSSLFHSPNSHIPQQLMRKVPQHVITKEFLQQHCRQNGLYMTPHLNDVLYLHHKGFSQICNLEQYTGLKTLWLENNFIKNIENLGHLTQLRCLFLQNNKIDQIANLDQLQLLSNLNLDANSISKVENLNCLPNLHTLSLSRNKLRFAQDIDELKFCAELSVLDLSYNALEEHGVLEILSEMKSLKVLSMMGNPIVSKTKDYRRTMIYQCKSLTYLDQRPIRDQDRLLVEAWKSGGLEAERALKEQFVAKEHERMHQSVLNLMRIRNENLAKRGIDSSDEAQLKAVEDRGRQLLEEVKKNLTGSEMESRDNTLLDPLLQSINLCMEHEEQGLPLLPDPDVLRDAMKHSAGPIRRYMKNKGRGATEEPVQNEPEPTQDQIFLSSLNDFAHREYPLVEKETGSLEMMHPTIAEEGPFLEVEAKCSDSDALKMDQEAVTMEQAAMGIGLEEQLDVIQLESLDPNQALEGRCPITGVKNFLDEVTILDITQTKSVEKVTIDIVQEIQRLDSGNISGKRYEEATASSPKSHEGRREAINRLIGELSKSCPSPPKQSQSFIEELD